MAWHRLVAPLALPCSLLLALACKNGEESDIGEEGEDFDSMQVPTTGDDTTSTSSTSVTATASATGSGSGATSADSTSADSTTADSTTGPDEPVVCTEDLTCNPGEICVLPCCGGPKPGCFELPEGGECGPGGTPDPGGANCCQNAGDPVACMKMQWCSPVGCTPDPPYCAATDEVTCNGTSCSAESCFDGELVSGQLQCSCQ